MNAAGRHFGLIGDPIDHSLSPQLFRDAHPGCPDTYDLIENPDFGKAFRIFKKSYDAVNVTAPFKEAALQKATAIDPVCLIIGATNLLVKEGARVKAYNTDMEAVMKCVWKGIGHHVDAGIWERSLLRGSLSALVIGCGGAGKAAAVACLNLGLKTRIVNRTRPRIFEFIDRISSYRRILPEAVDFFEIEKAIQESDIIIYAIPEPLEQIHTVDLSGKVVLEANYRKSSFSPSDIKETTLYIDGKEWLIRQAEASWRRMPISSY